MSALRAIPQPTQFYPATDVDLSGPIPDALVDQMISDAGSPREAVRQLLEGQRIMMLQRDHLISHSTSRGFDRCRLRPPGGERTATPRPEPLDF